MRSRALAGDGYASDRKEADKMSDNMSDSLVDSMGDGGSGFTRRVATFSDIPALNLVFAKAFTERYRRDGMPGVHVPPLNPAIWRYAIADAGDGALVWEDKHGSIAAFNMVHQSGTEGWMGPLAVHPVLQGAGAGKRIVEEGMQFLRLAGASVIGLETMPRTMENIGFYSRLGFVPGHLTITLTFEAVSTPGKYAMLPPGPSTRYDEALESCRVLSDSLLSGCDFTREIHLTERMSLGGTIVLGNPRDLRGFALWHTAPLVEGRTRDELRVLKLVLQHQNELPGMIEALRIQARKAGTRRVAIRMQGGYSHAYRMLIELGARVRWTDLRMSAVGWNERMPQEGLVLSNWEI